MERIAVLKNRTSILIFSQKSCTQHRKRKLISIISMLSPVLKCLALLIFP